MEHYFRRLAPEKDWQIARQELWRSVDVFGKEGSQEKENGIRSRILE
jgi:hypothetical protein